MQVEIIETRSVTSYIGIRVNTVMADLGSEVIRAIDELASRRYEIRNVKDPHVTYGITPPNYKGNEGPVDFYCCYEVTEIGNVPHGMVHIQLQPRTYSLTHYNGPASEHYSAYDYTSQWLSHNRYAYDDVSYYFEVCTKTPSEEQLSEVQIYCPVKKVS